MTIQESGKLDTHENDHGDASRTRCIAIQILAGLTINFVSSYFLLHV